MNANSDNQAPDEEETRRLISDQVGRIANEGAVVAVDPEDAEFMAAFVDDALPLDEALASRFDDVAEGE